MKLLKKNLWNSGADVIIVTGNSTIKNNSSLVMGRGAALEMKNKFLGVDAIFGHEIKLYMQHYGSWNYGLVIRPVENKILGVFQVKHHFKEFASFELIENSTIKLHAFATIFPDKQIAMNFPGIGYGGLKEDREKILIYLSVLPDNVTIFEKD